MRFKRSPLKVKAYWWEEKANWGDQLTPLLLEQFLGAQVERSAVSHAKIACVGSILEHIPPEWDGYVIGSGKLFGDSRLHLHTNTATILALRGPLSASGVPGDYILGDPGLLAPDILGHTPQKKYHLGLVPHWSDTTLVENPVFQQFDPVVIDPTDDPVDIIETIGKCHKIVTSSLHGMIVADSFGIPRRFEETPLQRKDGNLFKFHDYSQSIFTPFEVGKTIQANSFHVECRQHDLRSAFYDLHQMLRSK